MTESTTEKQPCRGCNELTHHKASCKVGRYYEVGLSPVLDSERVCAEKKQPCRECSEIELHAEDCRCADMRGAVNRRIKVLDSERVCTHDPKWIKDGICQFAAGEEFCGRAKVSEVPAVCANHCGHHVSFSINGECHWKRTRASEDICGHRCVVPPEVASTMPDVQCDRCKHWVPQNTVKNRAGVTFCTPCQDGFLEWVARQINEDANFPVYGDASPQSTPSDSTGEPTYLVVTDDCPNGWKVEAWFRLESEADAAANKLKGAPK